MESTHGSKGHGRATRKRLVVAGSKGRYGSDSVTGNYTIEISVHIADSGDGYKRWRNLIWKREERVLGGGRFQAGSFDGMAISVEWERPAHVSVRAEGK